MKSQAELRQRFEQVISLTGSERQKLWETYFAQPSETLRFLCTEFEFDRKKVLDVACNAGYYLIHFGEGSEGLEIFPESVQIAREIGLAVHIHNIEEPFPDFADKFDAVFFSATLEEVFSPHLILMRFRKVLAQDGLIALNVPCVPPPTLDWFLRKMGKQGYAATKHMYFYTPRTLSLMVERAGYNVITIVFPSVWKNTLLRPFHRFLVPFAPSVTIVAQIRSDFMYPAKRLMDFLPTWASELAIYHVDSQTHVESD